MAQLLIFNFLTFQFDTCVAFRNDFEQDIDFDGKYCLVSVQTKDAEIIKNSGKKHLCFI